ncbi:hypothetical protein Ocin01_01834 [Orchesella cincta]|uniref:Uncharacterized protein n=1 Tax=Orchesella cincta TaxID=48709 RepID=A0A1D2NHU3_ORCCI|nr:hypothetical protein Ocin01_01834 [Orchesella cincta]
MISSNPLEFEKRRYVSTLTSDKLYCDVRAPIFREVTLPYLTTGYYPPDRLRFYQICIGHRNSVEPQVPFLLLKQFTDGAEYGVYGGSEELPTVVKGITIAGITVISVATAGWASWGFIIWVWPRLILFAEALAANPETFAYLFAFLNSVPFLNFVTAWEQGKSLGECLKAFANTEFLSSALRMAPDLFTQFKKFPRPIAH